MMQIVELHFRHSPKCDYGAVKARVQEILESEVDSSDTAEVDKAFLIVHRNYVVKYTDGQHGATAMLLHRSTSKARRLPAGFSSNPGIAARRGSLARLPAEQLSHRVDGAVIGSAGSRTAFSWCIAPMIEVTSPDALLFKHSQQVIGPADYLAACREAPISRPGSLNVRLFNISNSDGDMLMDTRTCGNRLARSAMSLS